MITFEDGGKKTFVEVPGARAKAPPKKVEIKLGLSDGLNVEVVDGLAEGAKVLSGRPRSDSVRTSPRALAARRAADHRSDSECTWRGQVHGCLRPESSQDAHALLRDLRMCATSGARSCAPS